MTYIWFSENLFTASHYLPSANSQQGITLSKLQGALQRLKVSLRDVFEK
jgi:hypothetical protein